VRRRDLGFTAALTRRCRPNGFDNLSDREAIRGCSMPSSNRLRLALLLLVVALAAGGITAFFLWKRTPVLPQPGSPAYEEYVDAFEIGTAALDSGSLNDLAREKLTLAIDTVPQEPAGWANRGLYYLRTNDLPKAAADLQKAQELAPDNGQIKESLGLLAENEGKLQEAESYFRAALKEEPNDVRLMYRLYDVLGKVSGDAATDKERMQLLDHILELRPTSLFTHSQRLALAIRMKDVKVLQNSLTRLERLSGDWHGNTREALANLRKEIPAAGADLPKDIIGRLLPLQNLLRQEAGFARDAEEIAPRSSAAGATFHTFLKLQRVHNTPDPPDTELTLAEARRPLQPGLKKSKKRGDQAVFSAWLKNKDKPAVLVAAAEEVRRADAAGPVLPFPSGKNAVPPGIDGVLAVDLGNKDRADLVLAGAGGLKFHYHEPDGRFTDVTAKTKLPKEILEGDYFAVWAADVDLDGDLDIIAARRKGAPVLLRNNFDGSFTVQEIFPGVEGARAFAWLDLDTDGAPDAAFLDAEGKLHVFMNKRSGVFQRREPPSAEARYAALAVADVNEDGVLDLVAIRRDGGVERLSHKERGNTWTRGELVILEKKWPLVSGECRLIALDIDNNGAIDLVLRTNEGGQVWLADGKGNFQPLPIDVPAGTADVVSLDENGQLDFLGWPAAAAGKESALGRWTTKGTKDYRWQNLRARARPNETGDNRVNSQCLGSEAEVMTGTLIVKQPIDRAVVHFGLGTRNKVSVMRLVLTNGSPQFEFNLKSDAVVTVEQRLKGSCPFLFTWDGQKMVFVTDFCWSTPLGMYINGQDKGGFLQTTDWVKIRGDQLQPKDGYYDIRVNANLWETHFLDHLSLMVVDHPAGTEMHVDERFFLKPTEPQLYLSGPSRPVARAWDHKGKDVTELVRHIDGRYLDHAGRGVYQGVSHDHWVEVDLGDDAPKEGPVYLLAHGWIHPTDSSINFAMTQGSHAKPQPLTLEAPDGKGGWKTALPALGFVAGKNKTAVIRLDGIAGPGVCRRFRLRTNLEIFWDALHYAVGLDASRCVHQPLAAEKAELSFRGFLRMSQESPSAPELPHYDEVVCRGQQWRDLTGFHTRFGDVRELVEKIDDRYVIMNAGDEIRFLFKAPPPKQGWKRDFVWICDGWVKDGDFNTRFGKTVLPLPYHGMEGYDRPPGRLEDDSVYKRFPKDWETYHTRYVTPTLFERGLRTFARTGN
jgi:tetratricopeptide (TPR) repeat protein